MTTELKFHEVAIAKTKKYAIRTSVFFNVVALSAILLVGFAANKGWVMAQFIPPAMAIGGPAEMQIAAANKEAAHASRPVKSADGSPLPARSPLAVQ